MWNLNSHANVDWAVDIYKFACDNLNFAGFLMSADYSEYILECALKMHI